MKKGAKQIAKYLKKLDKENTELEGYRAKLFGEGKSVSYEIKGLCEAHVMVAEWPNGEGVDVSIETKLGEGLGYETKRISLHLDEMECLFRGLKHLNYI